MWISCPKAYAQFSLEALLQQLGTHDVQNLATSTPLSHLRRKNKADYIDDKCSYLDL